MERNQDVPVPAIPEGQRLQAADGAGAACGQKRLSGWKGGCPADTGVHIAGGGNWQLSGAQRTGVRAVQYCWRLGLAAICVVGFLNFRIPKRGVRET